MVLEKRGKSNWKENNPYQICNNFNWIRIKKYNSSIGENGLKLLMEKFKNNIEEEGKSIYCRFT